MGDINRLQEIAQFYDVQVTETLGEIDFEYTLQSYRGENVLDLHNYIMESASLSHGQKILDAGCGLGGPSVWFAKNLNVDISAVNISAVQLSSMRDLIEESDLKGKISIYHDDYHQIDKLFQKNTFDRILFLESFGHSTQKARLLEASMTVLKPGGKLYIKDPFIFHSTNPFKRRKILNVIKKANVFFAYDHITIKEMFNLLSAHDLEINYFRPPTFDNDLKLPLQYDNFYKLDYFNGKKSFPFVKYHEICCTKK